MSYLEALLVLEARKQGRAVRSAMVRHRFLTKKPLGLLFWQLGAEPFTAAAIAWGFEGQPHKIAVPGEPRDRELAFRALLEVARDFNPWFEQGEPQIVLPNRGNLTLLGRLGRRLAYLPTTGPQPADPALVRFGRHLKFLADHARHPGQQLVVVLTELLSTHWTTELSPLEVQHLPALDAAIEPPRKSSAHDAAFEAEAIDIGPLPSEADDDIMDRLIRQFGAARARRTEESFVAPRRKPIEAHYKVLVDRGWPLLWRCLERERALPEAPSVARRWQRDVEDLGRHVDWVTQDRGYRTRQTYQQAARTLRDWEHEYLRLQAEEAVDDPLRMIPYLLSNDAVFGKVISFDGENREIGKKNAVRRPVVELEVEGRCTIPRGKEMYWTNHAAGREWVITDVCPHKDGKRSIVTLVHQTGSDVVRPAKGQKALFSIHCTKPPEYFQRPQSTPWTHEAPPEHSQAIEDDGGSWDVEVR